MGCLVASSFPDRFEVKLPNPKPHTLSPKLWSKDTRVKKKLWSNTYIHCLVSFPSCSSWCSLDVEAAISPRSAVCLRHQVESLGPGLIECTVAVVDKQLGLSFWVLGRQGLQVRTEFKSLIWELRSGF